MNTKAFISAFLFMLFMQIVNCQQEFGFILIKSDPTGADVFIDGKETGKKTPFQQQLTAGRHKCRLVLTGQSYYDYTEEFILEPNKTIVRTAIMKPNFGSLYIQSNPSGASVSLDGIPTGKYTPVLLEQVKSGSHVLSLSHEKYEMLNTEVEVKDGQTGKVVFDLVADFGIITISIEPADAEIWVDGKRMGIGKYSGSVAPGKHIIEGRKGNHYVETIEINIDKGDELKRSLRLNPMLGSISVMVDPPESEITLDGKYEGRSPKIFNNIQIGMHEIIISKQGYKSLEKTVIVKENQMVMINESLELGRTITIASNVPEAELIFDNVPKGLTPAEFVAKDGDHQILLRKKYYNDKLSKITVESQRTNFLLSLERKKTIYDLKAIPRKIQYNLLMDDQGFTGASSYTGTTPDTLHIPEGNYSLTLTKKGFKSLDERVEITGEQIESSFLLEPIKYRSKGTALVLSVLWPGAGQAYLKRKASPHLLMGAAGYGLAIYGVERYINALDIKEKRDHYTDEDDGEIRQTLEDEYYESMDMSTYAQIGAYAIWGINLLWTALMPSEKARYDKIKMNAVYDPVTGSSGLGIVAVF